MEATTDRPASPRVWQRLPFMLATLLLTLLAHAVAYLTHEYSHSITAWSLGWMNDPFGIDYGAHTVSNAVLLGDVSDNVDYPRLFAHGAGAAAAIIALAGPFVGNGLLYLLLQPLLRSRALASRRWLLSFVYWLCLMCAGNVFSYVPIRAIATHGDIGLAAQGLGLSPWLLFPVVAAVSAAFVVHFFMRTFPRCANIVAQGDAGCLLLTAVITAAWFFIFFGAGGMGESYGLVSLAFSFVSIFLAFPLCVVWLAGQPMRPVDVAHGIS